MRKMMGRRGYWLMLLVLMMGLVLLMGGCKKRETHVHVWGEWTVEAAPDCTHDGLDLRACLGCEAEEQRIVTAPGHRFHSSVMPPSATEPGRLVYACVGCDELYTEEYAPATGSLGLAYAFNEDGQTLRVVGMGFCRDTEVAIPAEAFGYPVTAIAEDAFRECKTLEAIYLPRTLVSIERLAFYDCSALRTVVLPDGLLAIDSAAFYGCELLSSLTLPPSLTFVAENAFGACALTDLYVTDPEGWFSISFAHTGRVHFLDDNGNERTEITVPDGITQLRNYAFRGCNELTSVTLPESLRTIGSWAFYGCSGLTEVMLPEKLESIGGSAFSGCSGLASMTLPASLRTIGGYAFSGCSRLTEITIPRGVTDVGGCVFRGCSGLTRITVEEGNPVYRSAGNCLIRRADGCLLAGCRGSVIPNDGSVTSIGPRAFYDCVGLTSVTIPQSVTYIWIDAFEGCRSLVEVYNLSPFTIRPGTTDAGSVARYALQVHQSASAESCLWIDDEGYIFYENGDDRFLMGYRGKERVLVLPDGCNGSPYAIHPYAFYRSDLTSVTISGGVTEVGKDAFAECDALTDVTVLAGVRVLEARAFRACSRLQRVTLADSVTSLGGFLFLDCISLSDVKLSAGIKSLPDSIFKGCSSLTELTIPASVREIGSRAFYGCDALRCITLPIGVRRIMAEAFSAGAYPLAVYYGGSARDWESIEIAGDGGALAAATVYYQAASSSDGAE